MPATLKQCPFCASRKTGIEKEYFPNSVEGIKIFTAHNRGSSPCRVCCSELTKQFTMEIEPHTPKNKDNVCSECVLKSGLMCLDRSYCDFKKTGKHGEKKSCRLRARNTLQQQHYTTKKLCKIQHLTERMWFVITTSISPKTQQLFSVKSVEKCIR